MSSATMTVRCYLDDVLVAEYTDISKVTESAQIILDVSDAKVLRIESGVIDYHDYNSTYCYIVDDKLTPEE